MTEETAKWIPEVRAKYLRRQIKRRKHRKNVVASSPQLLKIIMALVKQGRPYELRQDKVSEMRKLEAQYAEIKQQSKRTKSPVNRTIVASHAA